MDGDQAITRRSRSIKRSLSKTGRKMEDVLGGAMSLSRKYSRSSSRAEEEEEALIWAAIEKLPTYNRLRTSIIKSFLDGDDDNNQVHGSNNYHHKFATREVDVRKLDMDDRQMFINALFKVAEEDNEKFLKRFRNRIDKVGIQLPTVEVRFENLNIEADTYIGSRALPTLPNAARNIAESALGLVGIRLAKTTKLNILKNVSGIIKPSRPTSFGKNNPFTRPGRKIEPKLEELLSELARREKSAGIFPEAEVDLFMKATAIEGAESSLATDYILRQRDLLLYPTWAFTIPLLLTKIPMAILESIIWMVMTYYTIGFAPEADRFFKKLLAVFMIQQVAASLFRLISGVCRTIVISNTGGMFALMFVVLCGGFTLTRTQIPDWWKWGYWCSPLTYGFDALVINEFYAPRWMNERASDNVTLLGDAVLDSLAIYRNKNLYWISIVALLGFVILFNVLFTLALTYLNAPSSPQAVLPDDISNEVESNIEMTIQGFSNQSNSNNGNRKANSIVAKKGMVLPFTPLAMQNQILVEELSTPQPGAKDLYFTTQLGFTLVAALILGSVYWRIGTKMSDASELTMVLGAMYVASMFLGVNNCQTAQPVVAIERSIFYRERAAGMYSALPYALAQVKGIDGLMGYTLLLFSVVVANGSVSIGILQVIVEVPYVLTQASYYTIIVFAMIGFKWTAKKFFWFFFINFFTFLYFTYYGMMTVAITPNAQVAAILAASFYALFNLFSGFYIPKPVSKLVSQAKTS
ncbi:ABC-2 type transporter [Corchorus olitorius]|uniref:ABC-2 type transporter n=1 Tax=Corchorus olitorius TaxID=93759 RepID=A0A1R3H869_9ROSI|nr:ABC-2 type transporter [Corchorus olitorius]